MRACLWMMLFGANVAMAAGDAAVGEKLFSSNCAACHGKNADGQGPAGAALNPKPTDFTNAEWWAQRTDDSIEANIKNGKPGTSMMKFAHLSEGDIAHLIAFLRSKQPQ